MVNSQEINRILAGMTQEERSVVDAIRVANSMDEKSTIDSIINDVQERRARFFDIIYVDLSIDRSNSPLVISGGGTILACIEGTDSNANATLSFELEEGNANNRVTFKQGKRIRAPFSRFYIYHSAQAGKSMKLLRGFDTRSLLVGFEDDSSDQSTANLETALANSTAFTTGQITVGTTSTLIKAANTSRKRIVIKVPQAAANPVYIGVSGVTTGDGHCIDPGDSLTLNSTAAIYGDAAANTVITYLEE